MLRVFLEGLALGFGASVPIGPVNILIMSYALQSYKRAFALGLGSMSADAIYLLLMTFGLLQIFHVPLVQKTLAIFGFIFLIIIGIMLFKSSGKHLQMHKSVKKHTIFTLYIKGLLLTLLNPYTVGFWLSIASVVASKDLNHVKTLLFGLIVAILMWISIMPYMVFKNKHFVSQAAAQKFSYIAGVILIFFAFVLLYNTFLGDII